MNFRHILVALGDDPPAAARVHLAARLAIAHGAHLTGIAPTGHLVIADNSASAAFAIDAADHALANAWQCADDRARRFRHTALAEGVVSVDAQAAEGDAATVLLHHAVCSDLMVVSSPEPSSMAWRSGIHFVEDVLARNPKPTLVVPGEGRFEHAGRCILLAWDDSPAAVRAAMDALPALRQAEQVMLCAWRRTTEGPDNGVGLRLAEVAGWLQRHGVHTETRISRTRSAIGDALLSDALALGVDLIVMGTYGHARWVERLTGGVTHTALRHAPVPLLMSH